MDKFDGHLRRDSEHPRKSFKGYQRTVKSLGSTESDRDEGRGEEREEIEGDLCRNQVG